ncbi:hypothetical protein [Methylotuvimicrobium sp. KM2]|uniref:hypothetical protein n=1 Tax=Methylotuvimicrobium sp. KM2 TaxID=3133976 RepID=UPI003100C779
MKRCPCCNARLKDAPSCSRCGADLSRILRCEQLAKQWLGLSLQTLESGHATIAAHAVKRSLSYRQTPEAGIFREFLIRHQYSALYDSLARQDWPSARQTISNLHVLQGDNEALSRFQEFIDHLSARSTNHSEPFSRWHLL